MLIGSLLRFSSSDKDEAPDKDKEDSDDLMSKTLSDKVASLAERSASEVASEVDERHLDIDELSKLTRAMLMDKNLEVSKVRPFFWTMVETYVDRFQVFPFDAIKALFSYLELRDYPEQQLRELVQQLEEIYQRRHGGSLRDSTPPAVNGENLDDEITALRDTLKYAAIVGERGETDE
ncbi:MAG: hypothetical protein PVG45_05935 [Gammaproteobacteria bacterium]|jgi:hypothetical protein